METTLVTVAGGRQLEVQGSSEEVAAAVYNGTGIAALRRAADGKAVTLQAGMVGMVEPADGRRKCKLGFVK